MPDRTSSGAPGRVPDLLLERYALGELPEPQRIAIERRLAADPGLRARLEALRASDAELLASHPAESVARTLRNRHRAERAEAEFRDAMRAPARRGLFSAAWTRPLLTGALLLVVTAVPVREFLRGHDAHVVVTEPGETAAPAATVPGVSDATAAGAEPARVPDATPPSLPPKPAAKPADDGVRLKGLDPGLALFRRTEQGAEALQPGAIVRAGDELRVGYRSGGFPYGAIYSVDGNGSVTRHWPVSGDSAGKLEAGEPLLPAAFRLDAAPDYERFYLLVSTTRFSLHGVPESLNAGKLPDLRGLRAVRFELRKDTKDNGI